MPELQLTGDTRILRDPTTGAMRSVPAAQSLDETNRTGEHFATIDEIHAYNQHEKYGSAGQTALAVGEKALRSTGLGLVGALGDVSDDERARAEQLNYWHGGLSAAAEMAGAAVPAALTGGAAGAFELGGAAVAGAEGLGYGLGSDASASREEGRDISATNIALSGVGGVLLGHVIPSLVSRGAGALSSALGNSSADAAAAAIVGDAGANLAPQLEQESARRVAEVAHDIPEGETRKAVMGSAADAHIEHADETIRGVAERAPDTLKSTDLTDAELRKMVPPDSPMQTEWATRAAQDLKAKADELESAASPEEPAAITQPSAGQEPKSPVNLSGKSLEDLNALPIEGEADRARVASLKQNQDFASTGKVTSNDGAQGITVVKDGDQLVLRDGRHRLTAAQELGRDSVHGRVVDGATGDEIFQGEIPINRNPSTPLSETLRGKTPEDLGVNWRPETHSPEAIRALKESDVFSRTGRVDPAVDAYGHDRGVTVLKGEDGHLQIVDGRHKFMAARELGLPSVWGNVRDEGSGKVLFKGDLSLAEEPVGAAQRNIQRNAKGFRIAEPSGKGSPVDFSDWDFGDFVKGRGKSAVHAHVGSNYGGTPQLSKFQRSLVDGIKSQPDFVRTGRISGDLGKFGTEPTFVMQADGTVKLDAGKMRMIAARELGMPEIYGQVKQGGKVIYDGMIPVGKAGAKAAEEGAAAPAASGVRNTVPYAEEMRKAANSLLETDGAADTLSTARKSLAELRDAGVPDEHLQTLSQGIQDRALWGRAAETVEDFERSRLPAQAAEGLKAAPGSAEHEAALDALQSTLDARAAAREKASLGGKTKRDVKTEAETLRGARSLKTEAESARSAPAMAESPKAEPAAATAPNAEPTVPAVPEPKAESIGGAAVKEAAWHAVQHLAGHVLPGAGMALRMWSRIAGHGEGMIQAAAAKLARGAASPMARAVGGIAGGAAGESAGRLGDDHLQRFTGAYSSPQESYEAKKGLLLEMMRNPGVLPAAMARSFGDLPQQAPQVYAQLAARMQRAATYVSQNLPPGIAANLIYPRGLPPSQSALRDFAIAWNSAMDPATVVKDIGNGTAVPGQIQAMQAVDPMLYQHTMASVTAAIAQNWQQVPSQTKQWLDILFQGDGMAGPSFSWRAAEYMTESEQQQPQRSPHLQAALPPPGKRQGPQSRGLDAIASGVTNRGA